MGRFFNNYTEKYQEFQAKISLKTICDVGFFKNNCKFFKMIYVTNITMMILVVVHSINEF